ncbi:hypothetical protein DIURU_005785 [Diutina rugosa]|uniref:Importin N-terminal domain-containing protein n=1 Tax=Diutina rugosa TaxID=5481 RepID=A0A642UBV2_DIURU|nr:uncharacterized protein DIURU_005785 [Diutina rugosa]KAA8896413.1 hypothetical protein DIURU_005785 [Diutina rugosa]
MAWEPDRASVEQLQRVFAGTLSPNNDERRAANDALAEAQHTPELENYLFYILMDRSAASAVRAAAGSHLKNTILRKNRDRPYLTQHVIQGLADDDRLVSRITANIITALFAQRGVEGWPEALPQLFDLVNNGHGAAAEAASEALRRLCEDSYQKLARDYHGERPVDAMVPQLLALTTNASPVIRANAIGCINEFIPGKPQSLIAQLDPYLQSLFSNAQDTAPQVRRQVCQSFSLILEQRPDKMLPHLDGVVDYCVHLMTPSAPGYDDEVAIQACEFLMMLALSVEEGRLTYQPRMDQVVPVLLASMVYSEQELVTIEMQDEKDDGAVADRDQDIKPGQARSKEHAVKTRRAGGDGGDDDSDSDSDSDDDDDDLENWSLRKCAASTLDALSTKFPRQVLEVALPELQRRLGAPEWPVREAAILAFGAMSAPCAECAADSVGDLIPFLVERLQDRETRVRQISCWTISRYADWVCDASDPASRHFGPAFEAVVRCGLDSKKVVQESACSALATFIETCDASLLRPFIGPLLNHFAQCFGVYQRKNMIVLYDCVQTFVEEMGYDALVADPHYMETLMTPLLGKWQSMSDDDGDLWPLLECMGVVAATFADKFAPYAVPVYQRAVKILAQCVHAEQQCHTDPSIEPPEVNMMITSIDLIDGLIQGFGDHSAELLASASPETGSVSVMDLVMECFDHHSADVRQSAYALLGDMAIHVLSSTIAPHLEAVVTCIGKEVHNRNWETSAVHSNAVWSLGEMALRLPTELAPYLANLLDLLIPVLEAVDLSSTVLENYAICLGRLGVHYADAVALRLAEFIVAWCTHMMYVIENEEKESAFAGMVNIIHKNPDHGFGGLSSPQARKNLGLFFSCMGNYMDPSPQLAQQFHQLLTEYHQVLGGDGWNQVMASVDADAKARLEHYG